MALFENAIEGMAEGGALGTVAVGAGVLLLAPGLLPAVGRALRPIAVGAIKTGITVYSQASSTIKETTQDLVAEARAEIEAEEHGTAAPESTQEAGQDAKRRRGPAPEAAS